MIVRQIDIVLYRSLCSSNEHIIVALGTVQFGVSHKAMNNRYMRNLQKTCWLDFNSFLTVSSILTMYRPVFGSCGRI